MTTNIGLLAHQEESLLAYEKRAIKFFDDAKARKQLGTEKKAEQKLIDVMSKKKQDHAKAIAALNSKFDQFRFETER